MNNWQPNRFQTQDRCDIADEILNKLLSKYGNNKGDSFFTCKILHDPTNLYDTLREKAKAVEEQANFDILVNIGQN